MVPHLPSTLGFELIRENPFFARRGDYTYDIDISLRDPHNRAIYDHIDRLTRAGRPQNRRARLYCDGHVICDGTEVILKKEGDNVKIQILAGNSELNILTADENLRIRDMDFGSFTEPRDRQTYLGQIYPDVRIAYPTVFTAYASDKDSDITYDVPYIGNKMIFENGNSQYDASAPSRMFPFLMYYVEKFIQLLGFTIGTNELLQDERWKRLIIINGYQEVVEGRGIVASKMLPDWSAAEFLQEIETFFNCVIVCNHVTKVANILSAKSFYSSANTVRLRDEDILDEFDCDFTVDEQFYNNYANVQYKMPDNEWGKYASLSEDVRNKCTRETAGISDQHIRSTDQWKIFHDEQYDFDYFSLWIKQDENTRAHTIRRVDFFAQHLENVGSVNTMRIVPAEIRVVQAFPAQGQGWLTCAMPQYVERTEDQDFEESLENGMAEEKTMDTMQVAFYGAIRLRRSNSDGVETMPYVAPMLFNQRYHTLWVNLHRYQDIMDGAVRITDNDITDGSKMNLELNGDAGRFGMDFSQSAQVNSKEARTIRFRGGAELDPTRQYLIHGRLFACQQLKYTYSNGSQHPVVEGIFFPCL